MSTVLRNPFATATSNGPQFNDPNKRSPMGNQQQGNNQDQNSMNQNNNNNDNNSFMRTDGNNNNNNNNNNTPNSDDPMSGLDNLWDDPVVDPKATPAPEFKGYLPSLDPAKFNESLSKLDFTKGINPQTMEKFFAGGEDAKAAFPEIMNTVARQVFNMSFNASTKMAKSGFDTAEARFMTELIPNSINGKLLDDQLMGASPLAREPKFKQLFLDTKAQLTKKYPKASADQIIEATNKYLQDFATAATKPQDQTPNNAQRLKQGAGDADFEEWLTT